MSRVIRIILDVDTYLQMSAEEMLVRNDSQSVLVHHTASAMVLTVLFCLVVHRRDSCTEFLQTRAQNSITEGQG